MTKIIELDHIKTAVADAFKKLKYKPQGDQANIVFDVVKTFLIDDKKNVVLGAPTGIGKSILGAVISETMDALAEFVPDTLPTIIAMGQNSLALQYAESFTELGDYEYFQAKGARNYPCFYMQSHPAGSSDATAEECVKLNLHETECKKYCSGCQYDKDKKVINATRNLITNYTYFMVSVMASGHLKPRNLHIFDEAHTFNQWFCSYSEILISSDVIDKIIKDLTALTGKCDEEVAGLIMLKKKIEEGGVAENNYKQVFAILNSIYESISKTLTGQSMLLIREDIIASAKFGKMGNRYALAGLKIKDFFENEYEHVFDNTIPNTLTIKTIFVGGAMMEKFLTRHNLFMSATITESYAYNILGLNKEDTEIIQLPAVFPAENKPLFFIGKQSLNYNTMKDPDTITTIKNQLRKIVEHHDGEKGLVLVPSFYLGNQLSFGVKYTRVFEHKSGMNLSDLVSEFKAYRGSSLLVSPSIYEGLSFNDDSARFQIIVKTPFDSLGDKRIKYIADNHPKIYAENTLLKIIQGTGRGVRSPTDYCSTFFLDASSKKLFDSKANIWKDHFNVISN